MAVMSDTRQIGDFRYRVTQLTALKSRALFVRLVKIVGPSAAQVLGKGMGAVLDTDVSELAPMLMEFCDRISDAELGYFCDTLGANSELLGDNDTSAKLDSKLIDVHFAGRLLDMFKWLSFALEVNFSDFLSVLKRTQAAGSAALVSAQSKSPSELTGTSGGS